MKPDFYISYRHGSHRIYACDINRYERVWNGRRISHYKSIRIASVPMNADDRADAPTPSYALKLLTWHERRATNAGNVAGKINEFC